VFNELLVLGLEVEQIGGDIPCVEVSALSKQGLPDLVETINAVAEVRDLRAEQSGIASEGKVIESRKEVGRGNVATVIVTRGTLKTGATIIAGKSFARVRMLTSSDNTTLAEAGPGTPVEVTGWKDLPEAGDEVLEAADEEVAKKAIETRKRREERVKTMGDLDVINEKRRVESESMNLAKQMAEEAKAQGEDSKQDDILASLRATSGSGVKELRMIIKADVSGTVEAVTGALADIGNDEAKVRILKSGVGDVADSDLTLAKAAEGKTETFLLLCHL
jgi:translation initiation factor IF-2